MTTTQHDHAPARPAAAGIPAAGIPAPGIPAPEIPAPRFPAPHIPAQRQAPPVRVAPLPRRRDRRRWPVTVGGLAAGLALGTLGVLGGAETATTEQGVATPAPDGWVANVSVPGRVRTSFGDGAWQVGVDVEAGTYTTAGAVDPDCVHALRTTATVGVPLQGAGHPGPATVVLTEEDGWFVTSGCATWYRAG